MFLMVEAVQNIGKYMTASRFRFVLHVVIDVQQEFGTEEK